MIHSLFLLNESPLLLSLLGPGENLSSKVNLSVVKVVTVFAENDINAQSLLILEPKDVNIFCFFDRHSMISTYNKNDFIAFIFQK